MSEYTKKVYHSILERTAKNLETNNMKCFIADTKEDVLTIVKELLTEGETVSCGGSATLAETGVTELLRSGVYNFLDRAGKSPEEAEEIYRRAFSADSYLTSSNAITENGELYNVDGNSNRVAAICFGPKSVIVVAGQDSPHSRGRCYTGKTSCCADEYRKAELRDLLSEQGRVYVPRFGRLRGNDRRLQKRVPHMLFLCGNGFSAH